MNKKLLLKLLLVVSLVSIVLVRFPFGEKFIFSEKSFPELSRGMYIGEVTGFKGEPEFLKDSIFVVEKKKDSPKVLFSLLNENIKSELVSLNTMRGISLSDMNVEDNKSSANEYGPLKVLQEYDCQLSAETKQDDLINGQIECAEGSGEFVLRQSEVSMESEDRPIVEYDINKLILKATNKKKYEYQLSMKSDEVGGLTETRGKIRDFLNDSTRLEKVSNELEQEKLALKKEIDQLNDLIDAEDESRKQLFRVSRKGIEVQLARRLSRMESDYLLRKLQYTDSEFDKELETDHQSEDFYILKNNSKDSVGGDTPGAEEKSIKNPGDNNSKEWWKQM